MKQRKSLWQLGILLCLCFLVIGCNQVPEGERISLIAIITKPEAYDGVRATVRGILRAEEEGIALYVFADPAVNRGVIDIHSAFSQHLLQLTVTRFWKI